MYERDPAPAKFIRGRALGVLASVKEMQGKALEASIAKHRAATRREMAKALGVAIRARRPRGDDRWNRFAILAREAVSELKREQMRLDKRAGLTPLPARRPRRAAGSSDLEAATHSTARFVVRTAADTRPEALRKLVLATIRLSDTESVVVTPLFERFQTSRSFAISVAVGTEPTPAALARVAQALRRGLPDVEDVAPQIELHSKVKPRVLRRRPVQAERYSQPKELICCCCRGPQVPDSSTSSPSRPTWSGVPDDTEWHLKQMRVKEAWTLTPRSGGGRHGAGILIGHPDTGWRKHAEYDESQIAFDLARNVLTGRDGKDATIHGTLTLPPGKFETHGTGTGAIMVSAIAAKGRTHVLDVPFASSVATSSDVQLSGVAPAAKVIPIRCTDTVVLVRDANLHKAIEHAIAVGAHVISISLGGVLDSACQEIIDRAVFDHNIIVVAAAGQYVDFLSANKSVIEPASYDNVLAVAGTDPTTAPWDGSCRGPAVDISAPAKGIWFPNFFLDGTQGIYHGEGTSFAAAEVAAVAALWLAHWGRDHLLRKYPNVPLAHVFRHLARMTAFKPRQWHKDWGAGIVDAYALLREPLPAEADVIAPSKPNDSTFEFLSGLLDGWDRFTAWAWEGLVDTAGAVGDFFAALLDLTGLAEGVATLKAMAEAAGGATADFINEQLTVFGGLVNQGIEAAAEAGEQLADAGSEAADAVGDFLSDTGELVGDAAEGVVDFFGSLLPA